METKFPPSPFSQLNVACNYRRHKTFERQKGDFLTISDKGINTRGDSYQLFMARGGCNGTLQSNRGQEQIHRESLLTSGRDKERHHPRRIDVGYDGLKDCKLHCGLCKSLIAPAADELKGRRD